MLLSKNFPFSAKFRRYSLLYVPIYHAKEMSLREIFFRDKSVTLFIFIDLVDIYVRQKY